MATGDLTTLTRAKTHLAIKTLDSDEILAALITSSSAWTKQQTGRGILATTYTEVIDGDGGTEIALEHRPVLAVTSVTIDGVAATARPAVSALDTDPDGYYLDDEYRLILRGDTFTSGYQNITVVYRAGYETTEARTIPAAPGPYTIQASELFRGNVSVVAGATTYTEVTGVPAASQYSVSSAGIYTFAAADAETAVTLRYAVCPEDLQLAVLNHVALAYRRRAPLGLGSASAGGESVTYSDAADWRGILDITDRYRDLVVT